MIVTVVNNLRLFSAALVCMYSLERAFAAPIEINIDPGSFVIIYFSRNLDSDSFVPITKLAYTLEEFKNEKAVLSIELVVGGENSVLHVNTNLVRKPNFPSVSTYSLEDDKGYQFGLDTTLGKVVVNTINENTTMITQKFSDDRKEFDNNLVIIVSKDRKWIENHVDVPSSFLLWNWNFQQAFDYLAEMP